MNKIEFILLIHYSYNALCIEISYGCYTNPWAISMQKYVVTSFVCVSKKEWSDATYIL